MTARARRAWRLLSADRLTAKRPLPRPRLSWGPAARLAARRRFLRCVTFI